MPKLIDFKLILTNIPDLLQYLPITLGIVLLSMVVGLVLALGIAWCACTKSQCSIKSSPSWSPLSAGRRCWYSCTCPTTVYRSHCGIGTTTITRISILTMCLRSCLSLWPLPSTKRPTTQKTFVVRCFPWMMVKSKRLKP